MAYKTSHYYANILTKVLRNTLNIHNNKKANIRRRLIYKCITSVIFNKIKVDTSSIYTHTPF